MHLDSALRDRGVFVSVIYDDYCGPPLKRYDYFSSTRAASHYLGYKFDAVGAALRKSRPYGGGLAQLPTLYFCTPQMALSNNSHVYYPAWRDALQKNCPELLAEYDRARWFAAPDYQI